MASTTWKARNMNLETKAQNERSAEDPVEVLRRKLANLQDARAHIVATRDAKAKLAETADAIVAALHEKSRGYASLQVEIEAFYEQEIEKSLSKGQLREPGALPNDLRTKKAERDSIAEQIAVAEGLAARRRAEAEAAAHELKSQSWNLEDALHEVMAAIAERKAAKVQDAWSEFLSEFIDFNGLVGLQFHQPEICPSPDRVGVRSQKPMCVSPEALAVSIGRGIDQRTMSATCGGALSGARAKWSHEVCEVLRKDARADISRYLS